MTTTLHEVQQLVDQLSPLEQVRLIAYLTDRIAPVISATAPTAQSEDSWTRLEAFWQDIETLGTTTGSATEQLLADRRSRQDAIEGSDHVHS